MGRRAHGQGPPERLVSRPVGPSPVRLLPAAVGPLSVLREAKEAGDTCAGDIYRLLALAESNRRSIEELVELAVVECRTVGWAWPAIAEVLNLTEAGARNRYLAACDRAGVPRVSRRYRGSAAMLELTR